MSIFISYSIITSLKLIKNKTNKKQFLQPARNISNSRQLLQTQPHVFTEQITVSNKSSNLIIMATAMNTPDQIPSLSSTPSEGITRSTTPTSLDTVYEVDRCVSWIQAAKLSRVALQFPDYLLSDAPRVCGAVQERLGQEVFILGKSR